MARVVKDADVRRQELLDTALELFETVGYERTSIEQITAAVHVAKGTFYHYFASKQELLTELVTEHADELFERVGRELDSMDADALTRLRAFFRLGGNLKLETKDATLAFGRSLYSGENVRLRHALMSEWIRRTDVMLAAILADGAAEGTFAIADPDATAGVLTSMWFGWGDRRAASFLSVGEHAEEAATLAAGLSAVETAMERVLGLPKDTLRLGLGTYVERMTEE